MTIMAPTQAITRIRPGLTSLGRPREANRWAVSPRYRGAFSRSRGDGYGLAAAAPAAAFGAGGVQPCSGDTPRRAATISPMTLTAISSGVSAPIGTPSGVRRPGVWGAAQPRAPTPSAHL